MTGSSDGLRTAAVVLLVVLLATLAAPARARRSHDGIPWRRLCAAQCFQVAVTATTRTRTKAYASGAAARTLPRPMATIQVDTSGWAAPAPHTRYDHSYANWRGLKYGCGCHAAGALHSACDIVTGRCECRPHVVGRACDSCQHGHWGLDSFQGCSPCLCDPLGALNDSCLVASGQCFCKPGIGGLKCDTCQPGYVGFSPDGCRECDPCDRPGHVCDPDTGHCVCPPLTAGPACEACDLNAWGFRPGKGCKPCACDPAGAFQAQCDAVTGECPCRPGYAGARCDACAHGYFGYPNCRACKCNPSGTEPASCEPRGGRCACDAAGQCACKANAVGHKCSVCRAGTFGLRADDPDGCQACFCFGRSTHCSEEGLTWGRIAQLRPRTLAVEYESQNPQFRPGAQLLPVNTQEICYINLALPGSVGKNFNTSDRLNVTNNLRIIPGDAGDVEMGVNYLFDTPIYWQLPHQFLGDRVLSFGGFLRFTVETEGGTTLFPPEVLDSYPLIQLQGNNRIILEHFPRTASRDGHYEVRLHHSLWRAKNNATSQVTRETLMLALQNLQHILIRATDSIDFTRAVLLGISLDTAQVIQDGRGPPAHGVEVCECPKQYSASSCQDPSIGFFRWHDRGAVSSTIIIQMIGEARPCQCSGRSDVCDIETGHCKNCSAHTGGPLCERCAEGFYGDPAQGECRPCPCPSAKQNFAHRCDVGADGRLEACYCREGHEGPRCDRCAPGWFGHPHRPGGSCAPCRCDPLGSVNDECDERGQCECFAGVSGPRCEVCPARQVLTGRANCTACDDPCTGDLLRGLEDLAYELEEGAGRVASGALEAPWAVLEGIHTQAKQARTRFDAWQHLAQRAADLPHHLPAGLRKPANQAVKEAKKAEHTGAETAVAALDLKQGMDNLYEQIESTRKEIEDTVANLNSYGLGGSSPLTRGSALADAQYRLENIISTMALLEPRATHTYNNFRKCDEIHDELLKRLDFSDVERLSDVKRRFLRLQEGLRHLNETLSSSGGNASHVEQRYNNKNKRKLKDLSARVAWLAAQEATLSTHVTENADSLNEVDRTVSRAEVNMEGVRTTRDRLRNLTVTLEQRIRAESRPDLTHYFIIARDRANMLVHTADMYEKLFSGTKKDASLALQASAAYRNIADALHDAWDAASNASATAETAHRKAFPRHLDSLLSQSGLTRSDSERMRGPAQDLVRRVAQLQRDLEKHSGVVDTLRETIIQGGRMNNDIHRPIVLLEQQLETERLSAQRGLEESRGEARQALLLRQAAAATQHNVSTLLRPLLEGLTGDADWDATLARSEEKIKETQRLLLRANDTLLTVSEAAAEQHREFQRWNDTFADKLQALRDKITRARHAAEGIHLSLSSTREPGGCARSFAMPHLEPSTTTLLTVYYSVGSSALSSPIFYLPSKTSDDFIALEMVDRRIRLAWDVGGGAGAVLHPQTIRSSSESSRDQVWYRIEAERTSNIGHLLVVESVRPDGAPAPRVVYNATVAGFGRLDLNVGDLGWVGGLPPEPPASASALLAPRGHGLTGCVHSLKMDGRPIGLWNFQTTTRGCTACMHGAEVEQDDQTYNFRGDGYSELRHSSSSPYNKYFFSIALNFRTFDENALLFLAVKNDRDRYVSLSLHEGRVKFRIGYGGPAPGQGQDSYLEIYTTGKYNSGNWTRVEASRYFDRSRGLEKGLLKVDGETRNGSPPTPLKADALPDLSGALYYIGGVPPGFQPVGPFQRPQSFLGCMSMIQVAQEGYNPLRGQFFGVEASCTDKPLRVVSFNGDGYLELPSHTLKKKASFGFVFATTQSDTMLMISTFAQPGNHGRSNEAEEENTNVIELGDNQRSYFSCSLWGGRLDVRVDAGRGTVSLQSNAQLDDGLFHSVIVTKAGRRLELRVDDVLQSTGTLPEGATAVRAPGDRGGLFLGGVPLRLNVSDMLATTAPFTGSIKDAIFNDELISMDQPVSFERAGIGRVSAVGWPGRGVPGSTAMGTSPAPASMDVPVPLPPPSHGLHPPGTQMGCRRLSSYSFEADAVKLGDASDSHVLVTFRRRNLLQKDFTIELQFRTYYRSGMLFMLPGGRAKQRHYLVAYLLDGILQVVYKGRNKLEVSLPNTYNNGSWHTLRLRKEERVLKLSVDDDPPEGRKGPKRMNVGNSMYIGGLPDNGLLAPDNFVQRLERFRGCMRGLVVNSLSQDLVGENAMHHRVGQCFSNVELGSYFAGDAYAVYKNKFVVGDLLRLEVEFRTSEMTGILLSVAEQKGYPAMSLELNNGKVVFAGDIGDRRRFQVVLTLPTQWTICDNRWHRIATRYERGDLLLQVDDLQEALPLADDGHHLAERTNSPLYIGGLPEGVVSETVGTKDNFKGCIRKVMVGGERRDWTVMADLHNIGLGSCPIAN